MTSKYDDDVMAVGKSSTVGIRYERADLEFGTMKSPAREIPLDRNNYRSEIPTMPETTHQNEFIVLPNAPKPVGPSIAS
jgi:hypothetical protein